MPRIMQRMPQALNRLKAEVAASVGQVNAAKPALARAAFKR
jgi:hypothetical protein